MALDDLFALLAHNLQGFRADLHKKIKTKKTKKVFGSPVVLDFMS